MQAVGGLEPIDRSNRNPIESRIMAESKSITEIEYRPIPSWQNYRAGSDGSIWTRWTRIPIWVDGEKRPRGLKLVIGDKWRRLNGTVRPDGRRTVTFCDNGIQRRDFDYVFVLEAFIGPCPEGMQACHFPDKDVLNCTLSNLRWGTPHENHMDMLEHGTCPLGEKRYNARLTSGEVIEIRKRLASGETQQSIADTFNIARRYVCKIGQRKVWAWLEQPTILNQGISL